MQQIVVFENSVVSTRARGVGLPMGEIGTIGAGTTLATLKRLCQDDKEVSQLLAGAVEPLAQNGAIGNGRSRSNAVTPTQRGNGVEYRVSKLARDAPEIVERMKTGEYKSVRKAAIEAGIVKEQTQLDKLQQAWRNALDDGFRSWVHDDVGFSGYFVSQWMY